MNNSNENMGKMLDGDLKKMSRSQQGAEIAALNSLLGLLNNPEITGAQVPAGVNTLAVAPPAAPPADPPPDASPAPIVPESFESELLPTAAKQKQQPGVDTSSAVPQARSRIFFTGRLCSGKDFCAERANYEVLGFADPLYALAEHFFGVKVTAKLGKDIPGIRSFLQTVGQWGRGEVSESYPFTPARACFTTMIRSLAAANVIAFDGVDWNSFGNNPDIWLNSAIARSSGPGKVALTNVRFANEFNKLKASGWQHWHVMCSAKTWQLRLARLGLRADSAEVNNVSEKLAATFDASVIKQVSGSPRGGKMRVIWNDDVAAPSQRMFTLDEFLNSVGQTK